jgi:hypothetical protein
MYRVTLAAINNKEIAANKAANTHKPSGEGAMLAKIAKKIAMAAMVTAAAKAKIGTGKKRKVTATHRGSVDGDLSGCPEASAFMAKWISSSVLSVPLC